jgi:iron complex outermembrane recepter protein
MNRTRSTLIGTAIAVALYGNHAAAQAPAGDLEEVVVTGIRASLTQSIDAKRAADAIVDAISAEEVGKFPDKNLAEALSRVPGVTINREFGEGERVSLRGTSPTLTRMLLNGHGLATADWFVLDQLNTTRSFNYLMLPSDIIGQAQVFKSPQADMEEGGVGGTINVVTRNPLDLESLTLSGSLQAGYNDLADKTDPQATALVSWKNDAETLGMLVAGVYQEREIRRDGVEVLGYFDADPGDATLLAPSLIGSALFQQKRERKGGNIGVQFSPSDDLEFNLTGLYSKFDADNINQNYLAWGVRAIGNGGTLTNPTVVQDTAVAGTISSLNGGTSDFGVVYDAIDRFAATETSNIDLLTTWSPADEWTFNFRVGYTKAEGNTEAQPFVEFGAPATFTYDLRGSAPQVSYQNVDPTDPNDMTFIFSSLHEILNDDEETYGYADVERELDMGVFDSVKFGAKYTDHDRDLVFNATTYGGFHVPINTTPASAFANGLTPGDFLSAIAAPGTLRSYWQVNRGAVESILFENFANGPGRVLYPQQSFSVTEKAWAAYVMGNMSGDGWRGNLGVRFVETDQTSRGNVTRPDGSIESPFGNYDPISVKRDYNDVLPSLNLAFDVQDDMVLRFATARTMARPDYTDIAPRASLNPGALTGTSGNPDIDPYRANQYDLSWEWYHSDDALVAVALYYKDILSFITDSVITQNFDIQSQTSPATACTQVGVNIFNCPFTINQRTNGGGGKIQGVELQVTQPIWNDFGVQVNYTYADADTDSGDPLPGHSEDAYNVVGYFENDLLSARLAYSYRSEFFVTFDRSTQLTQDDLKSLDASVAVNLGENFTLTFDAINLTEEEIVQYATDSFRPRAVYDNGRTYYAGVRFRY